MCDKNQVITTVGENETQNGSEDVIWPATVFHTENCLPVIGNCQVLSILSTLENVQQQSKTIQQQSEIGNKFISIPINIVNSKTISFSEETKRQPKRRIFQKVMYFGCTLCPFICAKDSKISDHIKSVHQNDNGNCKLALKCPGCTNVFYHKLSFRSHLIHDHEITKSDVNKIVNSVYVTVLQQLNKKHTQSKTNAKEVKNVTEEDIEITPDINESSNSEPVDNYSPKEEVPDVKQLIQRIPATSVIITTPNDNTSSSTTTATTTATTTILNTSAISTPKCDDSQKRMQKCCVSTCAVRMHDIVNMAYHVKCHFGKIYRCLECDENFVVWKTLQTHLWRTHNIDMELYSCDKCSYKTYSLAKLNNIHRLIHGNEKPFLCDLCGKGFKNLKQLRNHKIIHRTKTVTKTIPCTICERKFSDKRLLKVHIASVHQKLKPYACTYCGYKAALNGALRLHIRQHTGEKPFKCELCDYATADHNSLRRHKSRHNGDKKYKCVHCDYACIQSSTYKTHLKTKHPGYEDEHTFSCSLCQFRSVSKDKYMSHMTSHSDTKQKPIRNGEVGKPALVKKLQQVQETPVALISKMNDTNTTNCIILPVQNETVLNVTNASVEENTAAAVTPAIQYYYNGQNVLLEIVGEKCK